MNSQQSTFKKQFESNGNVNYSIGTQDNGIVTHLSNSNNYLIKSDSTGISLWTKLYSGSLSLTTMIPDKFNGITLIGKVKNSLTQLYQPVCIKLNSLGDTLWSKQYADSINANLSPYSIVPTKDNGYAIVGVASYTNSVKNTFFVIKVDSLGSLQWFKRYYSAFDNTFAYRIVETADSGYVVCGNTEDNLTKNKLGLLVRISKIGNLVWSKSYTVNGISTTFAGLELVKQQLVVCATIASGFSLINLDTSGIHNWAKLYLYSDFIDWKRNFDKGYVFTYGKNTSASILKTDSLGEVKWSRHYLSKFGSRIFQTRDSAYVVSALGPFYALSGKSFSTTAHVYKFSVKGSNTCISFGSLSYTTCTLTNSILTLNSISTGSSSRFQISYGVTSLPFKDKCVEVISSLNSELESSDMDIFFPNPTDGWVEIKITENRLLEGALYVFDVDSKMLKFQLINPLTKSVDFSSFQDGIYFYQFITGDHKIIRGKLIIKR